MKSLILILNPNAKENRRHPPPIEQIRRILGSKSKVFLTRDLGELDLLFQKELRNLDELLDQNYDLCFLGGDGSISRGLSSAYRCWGDRPRYPRILTLRGGTINMVCNQMGMKKGIEKTLQRFMDGEFQQMRRLSTMKVSLNDDPAILGFILAAGIGFQVLKEYYETSDHPGIAEGVWVASKTFLKALHPKASQMGIFKGANLELMVDGVAFENSDIRSLVVGTLSQISLGLRPLPLDNPISESCLALSVNALPIWKMALHSPKLLFGIGDFTSLNKTGRIYSASGAKNIAFTLNDGFTMDGEMHLFTQKTKIRIYPGPTFTFYKE